MSGLPLVWGAVDEQTRAAIRPLTLGLPLHLARGVEVDAPRPDVYPWLCQLKVAPYSYDVIDNMGRRSPRQLTPGLQLHPGDEVMTIFTAIDVQPERLVVLRMSAPAAVVAYGPLTVTYRLDDLGAGRSRIVCTLLGEPLSTPLALARAWVLAWGDLVMMRRQLLTLARLATRGSAAVGGR